MCISVPNTSDKNHPQRPGGDVYVDNSKVIDPLVKEHIETRMDVEKTGTITMLKAWEKAKWLENRSDEQCVYEILFAGLGVWVPNVSSPIDLKLSVCLSNPLCPLAPVGLLLAWTFDWFDDLGLPNERLVFYLTSARLTFDRGRDWSLACEAILFQLCVVFSIFKFVYSVNGFPNIFGIKSSQLSLGPWTAANTNF